MGRRRNIKSTKEETQKAQTNQGFSLCFLCSQSPNLISLDYSLTHIFIVRIEGADDVLIIQGAVCEDTLTDVVTVCGQIVSAPAI